MAVADPEPDGDARRKLVLGALLCAVSVAVFQPSLHHAWLNYDDNVYITQNPELQRGLTRDGVSWAFSSVEGANWFPLTRLSWLLDYQLHGLDAGGFHATNLVLHALGALFLFLTLSKLSGGLYRSAFVAAVFALHPLHVESVAWAAARKDTLSGLFFMLAGLAYAHHARRGLRLRGHILVLACMALGLMAKPILVTLPFALLLFDDWPLGRLRREGAPERWDPARIRRAVLEKIPMFALAAAASAVAFLAQRGGGMVASLEQLPLGARVANALVAYAAYLGKAFWPAGLAVFYPHTAGILPAWKAAAAAALLAAITAAAALTARRRPYLAVGWLFYLGTLLPVIGLVQVGSQAMADRYMYLPLIGLSIAVAWGVPERLQNRRWGRAGLGAAAGAALVALAVCTSLQLRHWRDSASLFEHALRATRDNPVAHAHLGAALLEQGGTAEAIAHFREAIRLRPSFLLAANNLAWLLATSEDETLRNPYLAVRLAERAARLSGNRDPAILDTLAASYASAKRFDDAVRAGEKAIRLARDQGDQALVEDLQRRVELYRARRVYRESAAAPGGRH